MHPVILKTGPFTIYSYGVMVAIGFMLATFLIYRRAPKFNINKNKIVDLCLIVLIAGIVGARALYIILNIHYYIADPMEMFRIFNGGLVWYGGFLSALVALILYVRMNGMGLWAVLDLVAPYIALAQAFGRVGCFLNGCCYGKASCGFIFSVTSVYDPIPRYPVQLYSAIALLLIFVILRVWQDRKHFLGEVFFGYCILYSYKRFIMELLRADNPRIFMGLTISQLISVCIMAAAVAFFIYKAVEWKKKSSNLR